MKLNIGTKVNLLIIVVILLVGGVSIFLSVSALRSEGKDSIAQYSAAVMGEKRSQIKDLVTSAYTIAKERLADSLDKEKIKAEYGDQVKAEIEQAFSVFISASENESLYDVETRKELAKEIVGKMRWGKNNNEYFWIQDTNGNMVHHPIM